MNVLSEKREQSTVQRQPIARPRGWCKECALEYSFLDLQKSVATGRDPDVVSTLYRFTDSRNLDSIRGRGVLGVVDLTKQEISCWSSPTQRSCEIDKKDGLSGLVRLALRPHHPMAWKALYEAQSPKRTWPKISASVLESPAVRGANKNAIASDRTVGTNSLLANKGTHQAEAVVPFVPRNAIITPVRTVSV